MYQDQNKTVNRVLCIYEVFLWLVHGLSHWNSWEGVQNPGGRGRGREYNNLP